MENLLTAWIMLRFTSSRNHSMDELLFGGGSFDRGTRHALQVPMPCLAVEESPISEPPIFTDVPVPEPFDVPAPSPMDVPPPKPRDIPPPKLPHPESDPKPKLRPTP